MGRKFRDVLTTTEAGALIRVSAATVVKLCDQGHIPHHYVPGGNHRRIRPDDLLAFCRRNAVPTDLVEAWMAGGRKRMD